MPNRTFKKIALVTALCTATFLGGCAAMFGESDYADDPLYAQGYSDGCGTGTGFNPSDPTTLIRDRDGWSGSKAYRAGWKKGFNACRPSNSGQSSNMPEDSYRRGNGPTGY